MYNLEIFQYIVFGILAIPPFVIGFKRGWKAALFSTIVLLALSGTIVLIGYFIYEETLWPIFRDKFVKSHIEFKYDVNTLMDISKPSILVIVLGIMILPSVLIAWLLYFAFKKLLLKHLKPRIEEVEQNKVRIFRKKTMPSRVTGSVLLGASGLLIASTGAAAVATFTVPTDKENFFTRATSLISRGYAFNQGFYDSDYQKMYEFLPMTHMKDEMESLANVFAMDATKPVTAADVVKLSAISGWHNEANDLMQRERAALTLVKLAISNNNRYDLTNTNAAKYLNNLRTVLGTSKLGFHLPQKSIDKIVAYINADKILQFDKTVVYTEWKNAIKIVIRVRKELAALHVQESELATNERNLESELASLKYEYTVTQPNIIAETTAKLAPLATATSLAKAAFVRATQPRNDAESEFNTANSVLEDAKRDYYNKQSTSQGNDWSFKNNNDEIARLVTRDALLRKQISAAGITKRKLEGQNSSLHTVIGSLNIKKSTAETNLRGKNSLKRDAEAKKRAAIAEKHIQDTLSQDTTATKQARDAARAASIRQERIINAETKNISTLSYSIRTLENTIRGLTNTINKNLNTIQSNEGDINRLGNEVTNKNSELRTNENDLITRRGNVANLRAQKDQSHREMQDAKNVMDAKQTIFNEKQRVFDIKRRIYDNKYSLQQQAIRSEADNKERLRVAKERKNLLNTTLIPEKNGQINQNKIAIANNKKAISDKDIELQKDIDDRGDKEAIKIREDKKFVSKQEEIKDIYQQALK